MGRQGVPIGGTRQTLTRFAKTRLNEAEHQALLGVRRGLGTTRSRFLRLMIRELIGQGPDLLTHDLQTFREADSRRCSKQDRTSV